MKIGDQVKFVNEVGGGRVAGFQSKNIVLVEDADGFQVPMTLSEVVVVNEENYDTQRMVGMVNQTKQEAAQRAREEEEDERPVTFKAPAEERRGGDMLSAYLAFVPVDVNRFNQSDFEVYFVNDSNYYLHFTLLSVEGCAWKLRHEAVVEPNTKLYLEEFGRDTLNDWERMGVQLMAYKRDKPFLLKPLIDVQLRIEAVKFYKRHTFVENDFFEQDALLYTIVERDEPSRPLIIDAKQLQKSLSQKKSLDASPARKPASVGRRRSQDEPIVVDLHATEILETTAGMSASDILNYQLEVMRRTLKENEKHKCTKIVFIHGKGEGVLRQAIINELRYHFKNYPYQDASFQEYGYGATQVTII